MSQFGRPKAGIQVALTAFVIGFPLLAFVSVWFTLWRKPQVLYHPSEWAGQDIGAFVDAIQGPRVNAAEQFEDWQRTWKDELLSEDNVDALADELGRRIQTEDTADAVTRDEVESIVKQSLGEISERTSHRVEERTTVSVHYSFPQLEFEAIRIIPYYPEATFRDVILPIESYLVASLLELGDSRFAFDLSIRSDGPTTWYVPVWVSG